MNATTAAVRWFDYLFIAATVGLTVFGQLVLKWRMNQVGALPSQAGDAIRFLLGLLIDPYVVAGFAAAFLAGLAWMAAMTRFPIGYAYPFTSLSFVAVLVLGSWFFDEALTPYRLLGVALIVAGTVVIGAGGAGR